MSYKVELIKSHPNKMRYGYGDNDNDAMRVKQHYL